MDRSKVTRREFLRSLGIAAGAATLAGCAPQVVKETVIVEKPVEKIVEKVVKETVIVEGTPQVVEKVITVAAPPAEPVTVTFWHVWGGTRTPLLREVLDNFEALNPGIKVEDTVQDGKTDTQKILTAMAAGSPPDLAMTHTWDVPMWAYKKSVIPLDGYVAKDGIDLYDVFYPAAVDGCTFDGKLTQLPFKLPTPLMMFYNKEIWAAKGLTENDIPKTWAELEDICDVLLEMSGDVIDLLPFDICPVCGIGKENAFTSFLFTNNGYVTNDAATEVAFDGEEGMQTLEWMLKLGEKFGGYDNVQKQFGATYAETRPAFYAGKMAMMMDGLWFHSMQMQEAPEMEMGVFALPVNQDNPDAKLGWSLAYGIPGYMMCKGAAHPDEAWPALWWMTGGEGMCQFFAMQKRVSPQKKCNENPELSVGSPFFDFFMELNSMTEGRQSSPAFPKVFQAMLQMEEQVLLKKMSPAEAMTKYAAQAQEALDHAYD